MEWILAPIFAMLLAMVGFVFWLGRRLIARSPQPTATPFSTPLGEDLVHTMLTMAQVRPGELICDLRCGDAAHLIQAVHNYGARCRGVEFSSSTYATALANVKAEGLENRIELIRGDIDATTLSDVDIVFLYPPNSPFLLSVADKLQAECRPGTRVVAARLPLPTQKPTQITQTSRYPVYLYVL